jgi:hypothetical protein
LHHVNYRLGITTIDFRRHDNGITGLQLDVLIGPIPQNNVVITGLDLHQGVSILGKAKDDDLILDATGVNPLASVIA